MVGQTSNSALATQRAQRMAGSLRGQLGVKSSPLCPTASKLTTQYLVLDHMNNHYKKLSKAKSSIDNSPPKSMSKSQKVRERSQRESVSRTGSGLSMRPDSRNTARPYSQLDYSDVYDDTYWGEPEDEEETNVMSIMKDVLKRPSREDTSPPRQKNRGMEKTMGWPPRSPSSSRQRQTFQMPPRPVSARSTGSLSRTVAQGNAAQKMPSGDVLEKHAHIFTEPEKPFTPRTLKSTRSSRLAEYKYYTAPKPRPHSKSKSMSGEDNTDGGEVGFDTDNANQPVPKPRKRQPSANRKLDVTQDSENSLMYETLQTRDMSRSKSKGRKDVPALDISVDKDHMNWLQEQASKAQIRVQSVRSPKGSDRDHSLGRRSPKGRTRELNRTFGSTRSWAGTKSDEEEMKYVDFVKDVTRDVLQRGIFTNRVLMHAFENHIQKNKDRLEEGKMRSMLAKLRDELGIPSEGEAEMDEENLGHGSRRSSRSRNTGRFDTTQTYGDTRTLGYGSLEKFKSPQFQEYHGMEKTGTSAWVSEPADTLTMDADLRETTDYDTAEMSRKYEGQELLKETNGYDTIGMSRNFEDGASLRETNGYDTLGMSRNLEGQDTGTLNDTGYTATLDEDGDVLSVTQALKTYQLNITEKDMAENHLARDIDGTSSLGIQDSKAPSEIAPSETARSARSDRPTPRQKRRMQKQRTDESIHSESFPDSVSQAGDNHSEVSVKSGNGLYHSKGYQSDVSVKRQRDEMKQKPIADNWSDVSAKMERDIRHHNTNERSFIQAESAGNHIKRRGSNPTDSPNPQMSNPSHRSRHRSKRAQENGIHEKPDLVHGSPSGYHAEEKAQFVNQEDVSLRSETEYAGDANGVWSAGDVTNSHSLNQNTDHERAGTGKVEDDKSAGGGDYDGDYADDYENDDADDEDATTMTHRTSDEDF